MPVSLPVNACHVSPLGPLGICVHDGALRAIRFLSRARVDRPDAAAVVYARQLEAYFQDPRQLQSSDLRPEGSAFQQRVWMALGEIPSGQTCSYGELATRLGSGARAVGNACRANPIPILIPCHRVVAVRGLGGYMGRGRKNLDYKAWLLAHEQRH